MFSKNIFRLTFNNFLVLINIFFILFLVFFFDIPTLLLGFTLWADFFILFYFFYLYNVPVLKIILLFLALFRFTKFFSTLNVYLVVLCIVFVVLFLFFIFKTKHLDSLKGALKQYEDLEISISDQVRTKFFFIGVLSLQTMVCSLLIFWYFLLSPNSFLKLLGEIESYQQVLLLLFLFLFFWSVILTVSVELIVIKQFIPKNGGFDLLALLHRVLILILIYLLNFMTFDYFILEVVNNVSGSESLISLYRIWRTGYSYNFAVEYSLAQEYTALTQTVPPLIEGTKSLDLLELKFRLNLVKLELDNCSKELHELLKYSHTWEDIKSLENKQMISIKKLLATFSSTESLADKACSKTKLK